MDTIGIQDVLAVRSLAGGIELLGIDPGIWAGAAELAATLFVAGWLVVRTGRVALWAGRGVRGYLFPAPPAPPEPDAIVKRVRELLESPGADWRASEKGAAAGQLTSGNLIVTVDPGGIVRSMTSAGQDVWMDVAGADRLILRKAVAETVNRLEADQRQQRRAAALNSLNGGSALARVVYYAEQGSPNV